jgi:hypothetical protein
MVFFLAPIIVSRGYYLKSSIDTTFISFDTIYSFFIRRHCYLFSLFAFQNEKLYLDIIDQEVFRVYCDVSRFMFPLTKKVDSYLQNIVIKIT